MKPISRLQYITTNAEQAEKACRGGVDWIQLRLKNITYEEYRNLAVEVQAVCKKHNATFIINDSAKLALEVGADGVHLGKEDVLTSEELSSLLRSDRIIGRTANTAEDIVDIALGPPVGYIGLGPFRYTSTKEKLSPILGIEGYNRIFLEINARSLNSPPIIGIGGITKNDIAELLATGLHGVAVSGGISNAADPVSAAGAFVKAVNYQIQD